MKKSTIISTLLAAVAFLPISCVQDKKVEVLASFTTDKDVYGFGETVKITNTTTVTNSVIAVC